MSWERFLTLQLSCFCLKFYPLILATYFSIYQLSLWWFSSGDFLFPFCLLLQGLLGDPLSIYVLISVWIHGYLFCSLGYNPILLSFIAHIFQVLAIGSCFSWPHYPFVSVLRTSLLYGITKCFRLILYIPYFSLWISQSFFSKTHGSFHWRMILTSRH